MIRSFSDRDTEALYRRRRSPRFQAIEQIARRKLAMLNRAKGLEDLRLIPGNRLERLTGDRAGQWSIRINRQWRLCFRWEQGDAFEVVIVDYH